MQGRRVILAVVGTLFASVVAVPAIAGPGPTSIDVQDNFFSPEDATQILGSSTTWTWGAPLSEKHNVRQDSKLFYSGPTTDDPGASFPANIASGTYPYYCEAHRGEMEGVVRVRPMVGDYTGETLTVTWGDADVQKPSQYDVKYRVGNGKWKDWIKNKTALSRAFGQNDKPVNVSKGRTYSFRARTELRSDPRKASGFSPVESFQISR